MKNITKKGEYGETPFGIITQSSILEQKDIDSISEMSDELKETFLKVQVFRTRTEMEVSVLNDINFPTHASKYWQAVREQNVMFQELVNLSYDYRKNVIEIKIKEREMQKETDELKRELIQIDIEKTTFALRNQEKTAKARIVEIQEWSDIKKIEEYSMIDSELENVNNHQLISYTKRWINQSILMGANGSPSERQNLLGQLRKGILTCIDKGVIEDVLKEYPKAIQTKIRGEYNLK